jgi:hypothetical protein
MVSRSARGAGAREQAPSDPVAYTVRWDLRVWNSVRKVWQPTGQSLWATISSGRVTWMRWYGWSGQWALPGTLGYRQSTAIATFSVGSSVDGLNIHYDYWH